MLIKNSLKKDELYNEGIKRIIFSINKKAISHIAKLNNNNLHETIHELRKRFKEARGQLRLIKYSLGEELFNKENEFYRDLGREISEIRDGQVFIEILDSLVVEYEGHLNKNAFTTTRAFLKQHLSNLEEGISEKLEQMGKSLKDQEIYIKEYPITLGSFKDIEPGIKRVYENGYKLLHRIMKNPGIENFHEWRKRSKYLHYQLNTILFIWPEAMKVMAECFQQLSDLTGTDHDMAVFLLHLKNKAPDEAEFELLKGIINEKRSILQQEALELGSRLYSEKPKDFIHRLAQYWKITENFK